MKPMISYKQGNFSVTGRVEAEDIGKLMSFMPDYIKEHEEWWKQASLWEKLKYKFNSFKLWLRWKLILLGFIKIKMPVLKNGYPSLSVDDIVSSSSFTDIKNSNLFKEEYRHNLK